VIPAFFVQQACAGFGVRKQACAFREIIGYQAVFKSGSELPHSEGALRAQKLGD